ncbi:MAG: hypothetical protein WA324_22170 [Bryobacteraceae bacterium]
MKLAGLIAIFTFGALPGLQAAPIDLTATDIEFDCVGQGPCGFYGISGPGFEANMLGTEDADTQPGGMMELDLDGNPFGSTLTVGNTTYGAGSIIAAGPAVTAYGTSTTFDQDGGSATGPVTGVTGEISVCFVSALPSFDYTCDPGLAFAIIDLPGLSGTFSERWGDLGGNPLDTVTDERSGSLTATITPEPLTAGIALAGLLLLVACSKCQSAQI